MKPEYEKYREGHLKPLRPTTVRLPEELRKRIEHIASIEGDTLTGLVVEGLARVAEDREGDPRYSQTPRQALEAEAQELHRQLAEVYKKLKDHP